MRKALDEQLAGRGHHGLELVVELEGWVSTLVRGCSSLV